MKDKSKTICTKNLEVLSTAIELLATDNNGAYPKSLDELVPSYLEELPKEPAGAEYRYLLRGSSGFLVSCPTHHGKIRPYFSSKKGLIR